ncbi:MAG: OprD family outer membrane porin [Sulfuricurvum sp.]|uniref:OprD family outer membrane porin n=1 Tax=Sulfuricurvum sp. TaxID=2025608 RepID=UPI00262375C8|nr:OprD family outer membrane porin [Sulfuricurvum sp.]MDD2829982.1 OprD family outer membrane porin [Sulfuricurvum sp.]MDD4949087.1 OprD family outer membrane porin [Sulfuricurvum sp.]
MKLVNLSIVAAATCLLATSAYALKTEDRNLKGNYQVEYIKAPGAVNSVTEMFTEGELYGRLRSNMFWNVWDNEQGATNATAKTRDNNMWGLGGSLIYKTGFLYGFGATAGFYGTVPMHDENTVPGNTANFGKMGKDTYHTRADGTEGGMANLAEGYLEYKIGKTDAKVGRQGIDSIMLATNDTKMIPNTFTAALVENKDIKDTTLRAGYVMSQKLRDHQSFHSILAYDSTSKVNENDDSGAHKGLSVAKINAAGEDVNPEMILVTASNKSVSNLKLDGEYVGISGFFSTAIAEANYQIKLGDSWTLTPGVRYLKQMDDGAGKIGGAALNGNVTAASAKGYSNPTSVDGSIIMGRLVAASGPLELSAGYSKVADKADIIAPWRGFPTGGYTRSMAQVDWVANTKNWAVKAVYDFGKAGLVPGLLVAADYENMNFDDAKMLAGSSVFSDRTIFHVDAWQTFKAIPNTEFKFRFATVNADPVTTTATPVTTDYASYNEYRFEINYLF